MVSTLIQIFLLSVLCKLITCQYKILKSQQNGTIYLIARKDTARRIPHIDTLVAFGFKFESLDIIDDVALSRLQIGDDVPLIRQENGTPDEILRVELLKINTIQNCLLDEFFFLGEYLNPSIIPWKGRLLMVYGHAWELRGRKATDRIEFLWQNISFSPFSSEEAYYGINTTYTELAVPVAGDGCPSSLKIYYKLKPHD